MQCQTKNKSIMKKEKTGKSYVVNCRTEEEANQFLVTLDMMGLKWCNGMSYLSGTNWDEYESETCYCPERGTYGSLKYFKKEGYKICRMHDLGFTDAIKAHYDEVNNQRRYEIARDILAHRASRINSLTSDQVIKEDCEVAIKYADELLKMLN